MSAFLLDKIMVGIVKGVLPQDILVAKHAFEVGDKLSNSGFSSLVTAPILSTRLTLRFAPLAYVEDIVRFM